jgi:uncharacterized membrane protein (DUF485 family)
VFNLDWLTAPVAVQSIKIKGLPTATSQLALSEVVTTVRVLCALTNDTESIISKPSKNCLKDIPFELPLLKVK